MSDKMMTRIALKNWLFRFPCARGLFRKFETDFSVLKFKIGGERSSAFRDEALEKIGFSRGEKFLRLFFRNLAAENLFTELEFARLSIGL
jgi:hypothetical protein